MIERAQKTMMVDKYWYPALNVACHFDADFKNETAPKKAEEMMAVAIAMAGMQQLHKKPYWIQGVPDTEQSPDVRTMCCEERNDDRAPLCQQQDVEVVSYTKYSQGMNLAEFVASTKLAPGAAYDNLTTILVHVRAGVCLPSATEWATVLNKTGKNNPVLVLGRISPDNLDYRLAIVHPIIEGAIDYNAPELLKAQGYTSVARWSLGTKAHQIYDDKEKHCPFENLGIKCKLT